MWHANPDALVGRDLDQAPYRSAKATAFRSFGGNSESPLATIIATGPIPGLELGIHGTVETKT